MYLGNLDGRVSAETLESLFEEHDLTVTNILVKRGYAFADCPDQNTLDKTIDKLHGKSPRYEFITQWYLLGWGESTFWFKVPRPIGHFHRCAAVTWAFQDGRLPSWYKNNPLFAATKPSNQRLPLVHKHLCL